MHFRKTIGCLANYTHHTWTNGNKPTSTYETYNGWLYVYYGPREFNIIVRILSVNLSSILSINEQDK